MAAKGMSAVIPDEVAAILNDPAAVVIRGRDGKDGANGRDGIDGKDGAPGRDGVNGRDGAPGKDGAPGADGRDGVDGKDGAPGRDGVDGRDGAPGRDGVDGRNGEDGRPGADGKDGRDGVDGRDGRDGVDGKNGLDGAPGKDGRDGKDGERGEPGSVVVTSYLRRGKWAPASATRLVRAVVIGGGGSGGEDNGGQPGEYKDTGFVPVADFLAFLGGGAGPWQIEVGLGGAGGNSGEASTFGPIYAAGGMSGGQARHVQPPDMERAPSGGGCAAFRPGATMVDPRIDYLTKGGVDGLPGLGGSGGQTRQPGGLRGGGGGAMAAGGHGAVDVFEL